MNLDVDHARWLGAALGRRIVVVRLTGGRELAVHRLLSATTIQPSLIRAHMSAADIQFLRGLFFHNPNFGPSRDHETHAMLVEVHHQLPMRCGWARDSLSSETAALLTQAAFELRNDFD